MKVLILNASPRKNGTTTKILSAIKEGLLKKHQVEWVDIAQLNIKPCVGCLKCRPDKICVMQRDDAHSVGKSIMEADVLIVGTPTYWGNMSGQLKVLFDRCVPIFEYVNGLKVKPVQKGKKAMIVVTSAAPFPVNLLGSQSRGAVKSLKTVLKAGGYNISNVLNISGTNNFEKHSKRLLRRAIKLGENI